jgi:hypothetical protein
LADFPRIKIVFLIFKVGDPLALRFEIVDPNSPYDIFVRELVAMDGVDGSEIMLLDGEGCPTDQRIMGPLSRAPDDQKALLSHFDAFKFPTSEVVQFRALVTPCLPKCQAVICPVQDSNGLFQEVPSLGRRRRALNSTQKDVDFNELEDIRVQYTIDRRVRRSSLPQEEMLLVRSIHISDRFRGDKKRDRKLDETPVKIEGNKNAGSRARVEEEDYVIPIIPKEDRIVERASSCINLSTVLGAGALVLGLQIALLVIGAMLFLRRRGNSKKLLPRPSPQQTIFVKRF